MKTPNKRSLILIFAIGVPLIIVFLVGYWIVDFAVLAKPRDEAFIRSSAKGIDTPADYRLVESTYVDSQCLDVCANLTNTYVRTDGSPVSVSPFEAVLADKGYTKLPQQVESVEKYTKKIDGRVSEIDVWPLPKDMTTRDFTPYRVIMMFSIKR